MPDHRIALKCGCQPMSRHDNSICPSCRCGNTSRYKEDRSPPQLWNNRKLSVQLIL